MKMNKDLKYNMNAVEGLPLKLMIIAIIMAISIPIIFLVITNYDEVQTEKDVKNEVEKIISIAKQTISSANGTSNSLELSLSNGMFTSIEYVKFGGSLDSTDRFTIRYKLSGKSEKKTLFGSDIAVTNEVGDSEIRLGTGNYNLIFTHVVNQNGTYITVKIV